MAIFIYFWSLKQRPHSMCRAKSVLLPSMCVVKTTNFLRTWKGAMQTLLHTLKGAMHTTLCTWS